MSNWDEVLETDEVADFYKLLFGTHTFYKEEESQREGPTTYQHVFIPVGMVEPPSVITLRTKWGIHSRDVILEPMMESLTIDWSTAYTTQSFQVKTPRYLTHRYYRWVAEERKAQRWKKIRRRQRRVAHRKRTSQRKSARR